MTIAPRIPSWTAEKSPVSGASAAVVSLRHHGGRTFNSHCLQLSTSISALSDSTTTTDSPLVILSPSLFNQDMIFPSVMVDESAGIKISLTALQVSIRWFRRGTSGFCGQTVMCLPASAGLLHGVVTCMALCIVCACSIDQRNAKACSYPTHGHREECTPYKQKKKTNYIYLIFGYKFGLFTTFQLVWQRAWNHARNS